eukprot:Mycagemm_TRINITY_DN10344_c1_g8::TRINITY_DN10344_c1_g8_i2::g.742::m.742 type:complete len:162 gc:universal TRINITY_DN10344_c1_g8_i2:1080-1565(+)
MLSQLMSRSPKRHLGSLSFSLPLNEQRLSSPLCPLLSKAYIATASFVVTRGAPPTSGNRPVLALPPLANVNSLECLFRVASDAPAAAGGEQSRPPFKPPPSLAQIDSTKAFYTFLHPLMEAYRKIDRRRAIQTLNEDITLDDVVESQVALSSIAEEYAPDD